MERVANLAATARAFEDRLIQEDLYASATMGVLAIGLSAVTMWGYFTVPRGMNGRATYLMGGTGLSLVSGILAGVFYFDRRPRKQGEVRVVDPPRTDEARSRLCERQLAQLSANALEPAVLLRLAREHEARLSGPQSSSSN